MATRQVCLALCALLAVSGCRTAGVGNLTRSEPAATRTTWNAGELIAEHNRNAQAIRSIEAAPAITVSVPGATRVGRQSGAVDGRLAMERPRNFKLEMTSVKGTTVADLGSNDQEFWFWASNAKGEDKALYYCNIDESQEGAIAAPFQPDWIIEALGLRIIPDGEVDSTEVKRIRVGTMGSLYRIQLTRRSPVPGSSGEFYTRITELEEASHRIVRHRIYQGKTLVAEAMIASYQTVAVDAPSSGSPSVFLPERFRLTWAEEDMKLDVVLKDVKINTEFPDARRAALFVEPALREGYKRVNLAERAGLARRGTTTIRETRPSPPSRVQLQEPAPEDPSPSARGPSSDPVALTAALGGGSTSSPSAIDSLVGPRLPTAPQSSGDVSSAGSSWRKAAPSGWEQ